MHLEPGGPLAKLTWELMSLTDPADCRAARNNMKVVDRNVKMQPQYLMSGEAKPLASSTVSLCPCQGDHWADTSPLFPSLDEILNWRANSWGARLAGPFHLRALGPRQARCLICQLVLQKQPGNLGTGVTDWDSTNTCLRRPAPWQPSACGRICQQMTRSSRRAPPWSCTA